MNSFVREEKLHWLFADPDIPGQTMNVHYRRRTPAWKMVLRVAIEALAISVAIPFFLLLIAAPLMCLLRALGLVDAL